MSVFETMAYALCILTQSTWQGLLKVKQYVIVHMHLNFFFSSFFRLNEGDAYYALKDFSLLIKSIGYDKLVLFKYTIYFIFRAT